jgi:ornithine cyclodeaminase/alanine dehydrogenase
MSISTNPDPLLILTREDISSQMEFGEYVTGVEAAFRLYEEQKALSPGVIDIEADGGAFHIKAAGLPLSRIYIAVKVNGNFPANPQLRGLPTIQGAITLCDGTTGTPLAFMDSIEITIQRTAAATAVAAKCLARPNSTVATICGCGDQSRVQLIALKHLLPLERVFAYDLDEDRARIFSEKMAKELNIAVTPVATLQDGTSQSDVIVTCTTSQEHFLGIQDVEPGTFVAAVGADSHTKQEIDPALMAANKVVADILDQCVRIGDLHHAITAGAMSADDVHGELGAIITGAKEGRTSEDEIIIFDSTGTALQDVASAAVIYERAMEKGIGLKCNLNA